MAMVGHQLESIYRTYAIADQQQDLAAELLPSSRNDGLQSEAIKML